MPNISTVSAVINGQTYNLTLDSASGKYKATITAPSKSSYNEPGHYYDVKVTAEDKYGNTVSADSTHATLGESLQLRVKEKTKPVITVIAPTAGATVTTTSRPSRSMSRTAIPELTPARSSCISTAEAQSYGRPVLRPQSRTAIPGRIHRQQHCQTDRTRSRLMCPTMTATRQRRKHPRSRWIRRRRFFP